MSFEQILDEFHRLSESRSNVLKTIRDSENEIVSISERIEELMTYAADKKKTQEFKDQMSKAKDKRKRIRQEIAEQEHKVRMYEAKIQSLKMRFQWLDKGGSNET
jgi:archaellum component FlaC